MSYDSICINCPKRRSLKVTAHRWLPGAGVSAGIISDGHEETFWSEERVFKLDYGLDHTTLQIY